MAVVLGPEVLIKADDGTVLGARTKKIPGADPDEVDISVDTDFPNPQIKLGWNKAEVLDLECVLLSGPGGGYAYWRNKAEARELMDIEVTLGEEGDVGTCQAYPLSPALDAPLKTEGVMSLRFRVSGPWTWVEGV